MNEKPLLSVAILAYKNYQYIKEALGSVFIQDYPNIQLIISNDGSDDFDESELVIYITNNRTDNIQSIFINNNERNMGTVKNVNFARSKANGEFFMLMAADDALYDEHVLSRFVEEFERLGPNAYIVSARTAMCSHDLSDIIEYFPDEEGVQAIQTLSSQEMFSRLSHTFTIPTTSSCYRMSLYEKVGDYDEGYFIIEDAPLYVKMARYGIKFHWIDDIIAARHRDGGVSHGNTNNLSESYRKYRYDEIILYKTEILPYKNQVLPQDYNKMTKKWEYLDRAYFQTFVLPNMSKTERWKYNRQNWRPLLRNVAKRAKDKTIEFSFDQNFFKEMKVLSIISIIAYLVLYFRLLEPVLSVQIEKILLYISGISAIGCYTILFLLYLMRLVYRVYLAAKFSITGR